jgi:hypothetical protein
MRHGERTLSEPGVRIRTPENNLPHVRASSSINYPTGVKPLPPPDGLAVGRLDGSANWVKRASLASYTNYDIMRNRPR